MVRERKRWGALGRVGEGGGTGRGVLPPSPPALSLQQMDPFPGAPAIRRQRVQKFQRGAQTKLVSCPISPPLQPWAAPTPRVTPNVTHPVPPLQGTVSSRRLKAQLALQEEKAEAAAKQAARAELLLLEEPG